jgi:hypothetical protein
MATICLTFDSTTRYFAFFKESLISIYKIVRVKHRNLNRKSMIDMVSI